MAISPLRTRGISRSPSALRALRRSKEVTSPQLDKGRPERRQTKVAEGKAAGARSERMTGDKNSASEAVKIAHLTMLQGVITRMGANSFTLKALSASFGSAGIAVMATVDKPSPYYAVAALIPILMFWLMDAQYLRYERGYRKLFDKVRRGEEVDSYSLDASPFLRDMEHVMKLALSWSVSVFYAAILIAFAVVALLIFGGK